MKTKRTYKIHKPKRDGTGRTKCGQKGITSWKPQFVTCKDCNREGRKYERFTGEKRVYIRNTKITEFREWGEM